jgi:glutathione S-transferase
MRAWLAFVDAVSTPAVRYPSFQFGGLLKKVQAMTDAEFDEQVRKRPVKSAFYKKMSRQSGFDAAELEEAFKVLRTSAARMDRTFDENGGPWLLGEQFSLADIAVAPLIDRVEDLGLEFLWEERYRRVADWLLRIQARTAYRKAHYHGSRLSDLYPELGLGRGSQRHVLEPDAAVSA